jgi:hypothetical protein
MMKVMVRLKDSETILPVIKKSASAMLTPDKQKTIITKRRFLPFWKDWLVTSRGQALELDSNQSRKNIFSYAEKKPYDPLYYLNILSYHLIFSPSSFASIRAAAWLPAKEHGDVKALYAAKAGRQLSQ